MGPLFYFYAQPDVFDKFFMSALLLEQLYRQYSFFYAHILTPLLSVRYGYMIYYVGQKINDCFSKINRPIFINSEK